MTYPPLRIAGLYLSLVLLGANSLSASAAAPSVQVTTATVLQQTVTESLSVFGVLDADPDQVLSLSLPHAGLINRVWARLGQRVKHGDPLLEVITDPDARMQYIQAQSAVDFAAQELERQRRLLGEQLATKSEADAAGKNLSDARAALQALQERGLDLTQETLRAPMDGIITQLTVAQGQRLPADSSAMLIAAEQNLVARFGVEPEDIARLQVGATVTITSVFFPELTIETAIREVHAMVNPGTNMVEVLAPVSPQKNMHLVLGDRILGRIALATRTALLVPRNAVLSDNDGSYLFTLNGHVATRQNVQIGIEENDLIEVTGDLHAGDVIVASGNYELSDGMEVRERP